MKKDKWMDIAVRWCAGVCTLIVALALGLDANLVVWLIVYAGAFFACWGIGNVVVAAIETLLEKLYG